MDQHGSVEFHQCLRREKAAMSWRVQKKKNLSVSRLEIWALPDSEVTGFPSLSIIEF